MSALWDTLVPVLSATAEVSVRFLFKALPSLLVCILYAHFST